MNKLIKLIYVYTLNLFNINKIIIARKNGVKSNFENRTILLAIMAIAYGYIIFEILKLLNIHNTSLIISLSYVVASLLCFFVDLSLIESVIFKNDDNNILFSFPLSRHQILFSKLISIYIKNIIYTVIIMVPALISYISYGNSVNENFSIIYIISCLLLPLIPIVISTLVIYINDYFKVKYDNNILYRLFKIFLIILLLSVLVILYVKVNSSMYLKLQCLVPFVFLFNKAVFYENVFCLILLVAVPIIFIVIYMKLITENYLRICSILKGVKKKSSFVMKKRRNKGVILGIAKKEFSSLIHNKFYFINSYGLPLIFTSLLLFLLFIIPEAFFRNIDHFGDYFNLYCPMILAIIAASGCSTISSFSLEGDNILMLKTMPIKVSQIVIGKWIPNIVIGLVFIVFNDFVVWYFLESSKLVFVLSLLIPFVALLLVSFTGILLDFRFIDKTGQDENAIISQRFIVMLPKFVALAIGGSIFAFPAIKQYAYLLGAYVIAMLILLIIEIMYIAVKSKKVMEKLI